MMITTRLTKILWLLKRQKKHIEYEKLRSWYKYGFDYAIISQNQEIMTNYFD